MVNEEGWQRGWGGVHGSYLQCARRGRGRGIGREITASWGSGACVIMCTEWSTYECLVIVKFWTHHKGNNMQPT